MSIMMVLEFVEGTTCLEVESALRGMEAFIQRDGGGFSGNFKLSNAFFVYKICHKIENIAAEDAQGKTWCVGSRLIVHCPISDLEKSSVDLEHFMMYLVGAHDDIKFICSFQYETTYAVGENGRVDVIKRMVGN